VQTLTSLAQQESARRGQDIVWVLTVKWPDADVTYAHRAVTLSDAGALPATLLAPGRLQPFSGDKLGSARLSPLTGRLELSLALDGTESPSVRQRLVSADPEGLEVKWGVVFLDAAQMAGLSDAVVLFHGMIERAKVARLALELACLDWVAVRGRKPFGRAFTRDDLPVPDSPMEGRMAPWILGSLDEVELLEWRAGQSLRLVSDVKPGDTSIAFQSVEDLPPVGTVQVGDERIDYDVVDRDQNRIGSKTIPLRRTESAYHDAGSAARLVPAGGFEWLVAGHACRSVGAVWAEGLPIDASDYAAATETWQGETIQKIVMSKWPVQVLHESYISSVSFNGKAKPGVWSVESGTTAINAANALDSFPEETAAELNSAAKTLKAKWRGELVSGAKRYGIFESARLLARVGADRVWEPTTAFRLIFRKGADEASAALARPLPESLEVPLPAHSHPPSDDPSEDRTIPLRYGPADCILDLTSLATAGGGWEYLDGGESEGFEVEIALETGGDPTRFFVYDLVLEVNFRARSRSTMASFLTARVAGLESGAVLLENPADIVKFFLCDSHGLGRSTDDLDLSSFISAADNLDALGYRFSNRLSEPEPIASILARLLFESRCQLIASGGRLALRFDAGDAALETADFTFDAETVLRGDALRLERDQERDLLRAVHLHHGRDFSGRNRAASWRKRLLSDVVAPRPVYQDMGVELTDRLRWHNHDTPAVVADLARFLLGRHGFRRSRLGIVAPLVAAPIERADRVALSDDWFPLGLDQGRVESVGVQEPHCIVVGACFPPAGEVCWSYDANTFIRHRAAGRLKEFWIEGNLVATVRWDGLWRLRGTLTEEATLYGSLNDPIEFNASQDRIYFGTGTSGSYTPRFSLDGSGNLLLAGALAEDVLRDDVVLSACFESDSNRLSIGIAETTPVLVYEVGTSTLDLRGEVAEEERFA